jgi:hypothetical protein
MFKIIFLAAFVIGTFAYTPKYTGAAWQAKTAEGKTDTLYNRVMENTTPLDFYSARIAELLAENVNVTFDYIGDDMPGQNLFNLEERPKLIHTVGSIAQVSYIDYGGHNFTGVFKGAQNAFIRFSLAKPPSTSDPNMVAGISMKFLRTGVKSANIMAMYSLLGQGSFNFFAHDFSNHPPNNDNSNSAVPLSQRAIAAYFSKFSKWISMLGVSDLAMYDQNGVKASPAVFPYRMIFHPLKAVHNLFPSAPQSGDTFYLKQMATLSPGPIYEVYAQATPFSNITIGPIGRVDLVTTPSSTYFGDRSMFFQHQRMEDDLNLMPSWAAAAQAINDAQAKATPYYYPDLPWN